MNAEIVDPDRHHLRKVRRFIENCSNENANKLFYFYHVNWPFWLLVLVNDYYYNLFKFFGSEFEGSRVFTFKSTRLNRVWRWSIISEQYDLRSYTNKITARCCGRNLFSKYLEMTKSTKMKFAFKFLASFTLSLSLCWHSTANHPDTF